MHCLSEYGAANRREMRDAILRITRGRCVYCGGEATTLDHVIARIKNPPRELKWANLVPACRNCNLDKCHLSIEEYRVRCFTKRPRGSKKRRHRFAYEIHRWRIGDVIRALQEVERRYVTKTSAQISSRTLYGRLALLNNPLNEGALTQFRKVVKPHAKKALVHAGK